MVKQIELDTKNKKLFCFDFDNTFMYSNTHNALNRRFILPHITNDNQLVVNGIPKKGKINNNYNKNGVINAVNQLLSDPKTGLKHPKQTVETIKLLLDRGHEVAITTFNKYPEVGLIILEQFKNLSLTEEQIKKINIISGFPALGPKDRNGKNEHIREAMKLSGISKPENVVLIDDSISNIRAAKKAGYNIIQVSLGLNSNRKYLEEIKEFSSNQSISEKNSRKIESIILGNEKNIKNNTLHNEKSSIWQKISKFRSIGEKFSKISNKLFSIYKEKNVNLEENINISNSSKKDIKKNNDILC